MSIRQILGVALAAPMTFITCVFYVFPFWALGWLKYHGSVGPTIKSPLGIGLCWYVNFDKTPSWLKKMWEGWGGHCVGSVVVVRYQPGTSGKADTILNHELHHVHQLHTWGMLQPMLYVCSWLSLKVAGENAYYGNSFEVAARRAAGQIIDGESYVQGYHTATQKQTLKN